MDNKELKELHETLKEVVMLLAVLAKKNFQQSALIHDLAKVGFKPKRIAELVGTTANTVNVILHKVRKKAKKQYAYKQ